MDLLWGILFFMDSGTPKRVQTCSVEGCARKHYAKTWCEFHYKKLRSGPECRVLQCQNVVVAQGLCKKHYQRLLDRGDPNAPRLKAPAGTGSIDNGYRRIGVNGKLKREHRLVMEQVLGRPLLPNEEVHHKNTLRDDNDPGNLELWVKSQPAGGRVTDLVDWAVELLRLYAPERLIDSAVI